MTYALGLLHFSVSHQQDLPNYDTMCVQYDFSSR